jgi:hypothetical protein
MISPLPLPEKVRPGEALSAAAWNGLVDATLALAVQMRWVEAVPPGDHPWRVAVGREGVAGKEKLRVRVQAGTVNDVAAVVVWKVKGDPRGDMPAASEAARQEALAATPASAYLKDYWDRPLHEADPPTCLLELDPLGKDWAPCLVTRVPKALRESMPEEAKYYQAGVVLSVVNYNLLVPHPMPKRYRVYAGKANPAQMRSAAVGEVLELARLTQVRDGAGALLACSVRQLVFWNLGTMAYEPQLQVDVPPLPVPVFGIGLGLLDAWTGMESLLTAEVNRSLANIESQMDSTEFWTNG